MLNTAIFEFDRFEVTKYPMFQNSSREPLVVRFVSYAESSLTYKLELNHAISDFDRFEVHLKSAFSQVVVET